MESESFENLTHIVTFTFFPLFQKICPNIFFLIQKVNADRTISYGENKAAKENWVTNIFCSFPLISLLSITEKKTAPDVQFDRNLAACSVDSSKRLHLSFPHR